MPPPYEVLIIHILFLHVALLLLYTLPPQKDVIVLQISLKWYLLTLPSLLWRVQPTNL